MNSGLKDTFPKHQNDPVRRFHEDERDNCPELGVRFLPGWRVGAVCRADTMPAIGAIEGHQDPAVRTVEAADDENLREFDQQAEFNPALLNGFDFLPKLTPLRKILNSWPPAR